MTHATYPCDEARSARAAFVALFPQESQSRHKSLVTFARDLNLARLE